MATYEIKGPDGKLYRVDGPEGATREQIIAEVTRQLQAGNQREFTPALTPLQQMEEQRQGMGMGIGDVLAGSAQLAQRIAPDFAVNAANAVRDVFPGGPGDITADQSRQRLDQTLANREQAYQGFRADPGGFDTSRLAGNIVGTLPMAFAGGASLPGALAFGAGMGATVPQTGGEFSWRDKALQTGAGMFGAGAGNQLGRLASNLIAPNVAAGVANLTSRGVRPTVGQSMGGAANAFEQKLTSVPVVGDFISSARRRAVDDFNRAIYDDILSPIGGKAPEVAGREAVAEVGDQISRGYDELLPQVTFGTDAQFGQDFTAIMRDVIALPESLSNRYMAFVDDRLTPSLAPTGTMTGEAFKTIESDLAGLARKYSKSTTASEQELGDALTNLLTSMREGLARTNSGVQINVNGTMVDAGQRLADLNGAWAKLVRLERATGSVAAEHGVFSPAQLLSAVKATDSSVRNRNFARGDALLQGVAEDAKSVLGNTVPDSGTPGRLAALLASGGLSAGYFLDPSLAIAGGAAILPYTRTGQNLTSALMSRQAGPQSQALATMLRDGFPFLSAAGAQGAGMVPK
jgi:hypothetical protein